ITRPQFPPVANGVSLARLKLSEATTCELDGTGIETATTSAAAKPVIKARFCGIEASPLECAQGQGEWSPNVPQACLCRYPRPRPQGANRSDRLNEARRPTGSGRRRSRDAKRHDRKPRAVVVMTPNADGRQRAP